MLDRQGSRFALEVLFLAALAAGLALAKLNALEIIFGMALGWGIVALLEWAAWRNEPHYGSGLPPRYYVPTTSLPPPQPLEQVFAGYPDPQREEAPTWIASADQRAKLLGEWPVLAAADDDDADDELDAEPVRLPPAPVAALPAPAPAPATPVAAAVAPSPPAPAPLPELPPAAARDDRTASHQLEAFAAPAERRRFGRRTTVDVLTVVVPARVVPTVLPKPSDGE